MELSFDLSDHEIEKLDAILKETGLNSYTELFNGSLSLFYWATEQAKNGRAVASVYDGGQKYTELQMPALLHIAKTKAAAEAAVSEPQVVA